MEHLLQPGMKPFFRAPLPTTPEHLHELQATPPSSEWLIIKDGGLKLGCVDALVQSPNKTKEFKFLWAWLLEQYYFGLLDEFFGGAFSREDFVDNSTGKLMLTTAHLERHLCDWRDRILETSTGDPEPKELLDASTTFEQSISGVAGLKEAFDCVYEDSANFENEAIIAVSKVALAITLLLESLVHAYGRVFGDQPRSIEAFRDVNYIVPDIWLRREIRLAGWCPFLVSRIESLTTAPILFMLACGTARSKQDHKYCTVVVCKANIAEEHAKPKHLTDDCKCAPLCAPDNQVAEIISGGGVPVMRESQPELGARKLEAGVGGLQQPYVAVSHLWADGLGCQKANVIRACQISRLEDAIKGIRQQLGLPQLALWADTLCIPVDPAKIHLRNAQILKMRDIYSSAAAVLVIDPDFLDLGLQSSLVEFAAKVGISAWSSRLWTYQESKFNGRLFMQVSDGLMDFDLAMQRLNSGYTAYGKENDARWPGTMAHDLYRLSAGKALRALDRIPPSHTAANPNTATNFIYQAKHVDGMLWALSDRTTSHEEDEAVVIASALGLHTDEILKASDSEARMIALLRALGTIPSSVVFTRSPRLQTAGFRWAPASFLRSRGAFVPAAQGYFASAITFPGNTQGVGRRNSVLAADNTSLCTFLPGMRLHVQHLEGILTTTSEVKVRILGQTLELSVISGYDGSIDDEEHRPYTLETILSECLHSRAESLVILFEPRMDRSSTIYCRGMLAFTDLQSPSTTSEKHPHTLASFVSTGDVILPRLEPTSPHSSPPSQVHQENTEPKGVGSRWRRSRTYVANFSQRLRLRFSRRTKSPTGLEPATEISEVSIEGEWLPPRWWKITG